MEDELVKMDQGSVPHWHGSCPDIRIGGMSKNKEAEEDLHVRKIHTMFHPQRMGVTAACSEEVRKVGKYRVEY
jgi:hypothetical protein